MGADFCSVTDSHRAAGSSSQISWGLHRITALRIPLSHYETALRNRLIRLRQWWRIENAEWCAVINNCLTLGIFALRTWLCITHLIPHYASDFALRTLHYAFDSALRAWFLSICITHLILHCVSDSALRFWFRISHLISHYSADSALRSWYRSTLLGVRNACVMRA